MLNGVASKGRAAIIPSMSERFSWPAWQRELRRKYPSLFRGADKSLRESLMPFGCDCGPGWRLIIEAVCDVLDRYTRQLALPDGQAIELVQVKEKFGALILDVRAGDDYVFALTDAAEVLSLYTCEACGAAGRLREKAWVQTLCDEHAAGQPPKPWDRGWLTWTIGDDDVPILREVSQELRGLPEPTARAANLVSYDAARRWPERPELSAAGLDECGDLRFGFETLEEVPVRLRAAADLARAFVRISSQ